MRECCFTQTRWAIQKHVLWLMISAFRCGKEDTEVLLNPFLPHIFFPIGRTKRLVERAWRLFYLLFVGIHIFGSLAHRDEAGEAYLRATRGIISRLEGGLTKPYNMLYFCQMRT